jgi:predicted nucleic acid-binding protein
MMPTSSDPWTTGGSCPSGIPDRYERRLRAAQGRGGASTLHRLVDPRGPEHDVSVRARGGEIRRGVENLRRKDPVQAQVLDAWLGHVVSFHGRILPVTQEIAETWGRLSVPDRLPVADGLLAATAIVHNLILVTRNTRDVARTGVTLLNPFDELFSET